jgi:hypothetical protein
VDQRDDGRPPALIRHNLTTMVNAAYVYVAARAAPVLEIGAAS